MTPNFQWLLLWLHDNFLDARLWTRDRIDEIITLLRTALIACGALIGLGVLIASLSYDGEPVNGRVRFGCLLISLGGLVAGILFLIVLARIAKLTALVGLAAGAVHTISPLVRGLSRPLPGEPIDIRVISPQDATRSLRYVLGVLAAFMGAAVYAALVPVYTNPGGFLTALVLIFFIAYGTFAWLPDSDINVGRIAVIVACVALLLITVSMFIPQSIRRELSDTTWHTAERIAKNQGHRRELEVAGDAIRRNALQYEKDALANIDTRLQALHRRFAANAGKLSAADAAELQELNTRKASIMAGGALGQVNTDPVDPTVLLPSFSFSGNWLLILGVAALALAVMIIKRPKVKPVAPAAAPAAAATTTTTVTTPEPAPRGGRRRG